MESVMPLSKASSVASFPNEQLLQVNSLARPLNLFSPQPPYTTRTSSPISSGSGYVLGPAPFPRRDGEDDQAKAEQGQRGRYWELSAGARAI